MSGFSTDTLLVRTGDGHNFLLAEAFSYATKGGEVLTVPVGTTCDGASTPRAIWREVPPFGAYWKAAFLHDFLYRDSQRPKSFCDSVFLEAMLTLGVPTAEAWSIYEGVHLFGGEAFKEDRKQEPSK